jgi:aminoglycoside phosphotransferase (APT) family kinase protein
MTVPDGRVEPALAWCRRALGGVCGVLRAELIGGGRSNLTYRLSDGSGASWILRRPPVGPLLPRAHDMGREYRVLRALRARSDVPVPCPLALCEDPLVLGVPFYLMSDVAGTVLRQPEDAAHIPAATRRRVTMDATGVLASIHRVDLERVGLDGLASHSGYLERQLRRWLQQVELSGDVRAGVLLGACQQRLLEALPDDRRPTLVHGDYRFDNLIVDRRTGAIRAVVDWEIATIGDPVADLATWIACWDEPGDERPALGMRSASSAGGFGSRQDLVDLYADASGRRPDHLDYYLAFAYWKLACVLQGVAHRYRAGSSGGSPAEGLGPEHLEWLAGRSYACLRAYARSVGR